MRPLDAAPAALIAGLSLIVLASATGLAMWQDFTPGPGFFPRILAAAGLGLGAAELVAAWRGAAPVGEGPGAAGLSRVWLTVAAMGGFALLAPYAGMTPAAALFIAFMLTAVLRRRLVPSLAVAVGVAAGIELLFVRWLGVALPAAPFLA